MIYSIYIHSLLSNKANTDSVPFTQISLSGNGTDTICIGILGILRYNINPISCIIQKNNSKKHTTY